VKRILVAAICFVVLLTLVTGCASGTVSGIVTSKYYTPEKTEEYSIPACNGKSITITVTSEEKWELGIESGYWTLHRIEVEQAVWETVIVGSTITLILER
jgi:hypothetical protein